MEKTSLSDLWIQIKYGQSGTNIKLLSTLPSNE